MFSIPIGGYGDEDPGAARRAGSGAARWMFWEREPGCARRTGGR